jgi:hypothetical protein
VVTKKTTWFKKIAAGFLLLMLFTATVLKVLHFHSSSTASVLKIQLQKNSFSKYPESVKDIKCFICDYQLIKDTDTGNFLSYIFYPAEFNKATAASYTFTPQHKCAAFNSRGPPLSM